MRKYIIIDKCYLSEANQEKIKVVCRYHAGDIDYLLCTKTARQKNARHFSTVGADSGEIVVAEILDGFDWLGIDAGYSGYAEIDDNVLEKLYVCDEYGVELEPEA